MSDPKAFASASSNPKFANLMKKMREKMGIPEEGIPAHSDPPSTGPQSKRPGDDGQLFIKSLFLYLYFSLQTWIRYRERFVFSDR